MHINIVSLIERYVYSLKRNSNKFIKMTNTKYNPFNGLKTLVHVEYWKPIVESHIIPPPRLVSLDPCGICDYACPFCNSSYIMEKHSEQMSLPMIKNIVSLLSEWKTRAVCIGGGGESLLNEHTSYLINELADLKIQIGLITNGTHIPNHLDALKRCKWVAISMDSGNRETYKKMKGVTTDRWDQALQNIKTLSETGVDTTWKFLIHPDNFNEIYDACKLAKEVGCSIIHIRPGSYAWFSSKKNKSFEFSENVVTLARNQIQRAKAEFESNTFKVVSVEDKFTLQWGIKKTFSKCYAVLTHCVIDSKGNINLCCDRRGDAHTTLGTLDTIREKWGSEEHWKIHENIKIEQCPRCTSIHVNETFENVIVNDNMLYNMY